MRGLDRARAAEPSVVGIFVGGLSRRMGGEPKGLLTSPETNEPLVVSLVAAARAAGLEPVLVGDALGYAAVVQDVARIADAPAGVGPLGGLRALLSHAGRRRALAVACDMPHVTPPLLSYLDAFDAAAPVVAPRARSGVWEPLLARYEPERVMPELDRALADGVRSFQRFFERIEVLELPLVGAERRALVDWDTPEDRAADVSEDPASGAPRRPPRA